MMTERLQTRSDAYINLYIGNHGKQDGIEDYITLFTKLLADRGLALRVTSAFDPQAVNLVIDEFTNYAENNRLSVFKRNHPESKIVVVLTEFIVRKWGVESFNHFGNLFDAAAIALFDVGLKNVRKDFGAVCSGSLIRLLGYSPLLLVRFLVDILRSAWGLISRRKLQGPIANFFQAYNRLAYLHARYLGLKTNLHHADGIIVSHEGIMDGLVGHKSLNASSMNYLGVCYPEFDERGVVDSLMAGKKPFFEVTGTITSYRQSWINRINRRLVFLGLQNVFLTCKAFRFSEDEEDTPVLRGAYSLHPPQTRFWPYCSPTRIFRALTEDHNLPVLTHHFHQNPIEDVCYLFEDEKSMLDLYEMYFDRERAANFLAPRLQRYNRIVSGKNDELAEKLRAVMRTLEVAG